MKNQFLFTTAVTICLAVMARAEEPKEIPEAKPANKKTGGTNQVQAINAYVRGVEKKHSSYQHKQAKLAQGQFRKVTNEEWSKIDSYWEGTTLKRMRLYPVGGSKKTEEFYYNGNAPVFVFLEENGADSENHDSAARGEKFYFANGQLIAAMDENGKAMDLKNDATKKQAAKLKKESQAFRAAVK